MFNFLKRHPQNKELDKLVQNIEVNAANNYKYAAQQSLEESCKLSDKQCTYYKEKLMEFKAQMKNFTHKEQKPTWV